MAVNVLVSFAYFGKRDMWTIRAALPCGRLMIDSGAFTALNTGVPIDLHAYAEFLQTFAGAWDHAVTLDVIGDPAGTRANTRKLHGLGIPVMPVFTLGDSLTEFDAMVKESGYVMVGGLVGMPNVERVRRIGVLQHRALQQGGGIHALGVGVCKQVRQGRPYSADSSNASNSYRFGRLRYFDGEELFHVSITDKTHMRRVLPHLTSHGFDVARLHDAGRMPGVGEGRQTLMTSMILAYATADEYLVQRFGPVPPPRGVPDTPGPHLYAALRHLMDMTAAAAVNVAIHSEAPPPVYRPFRAGHVCHGGPRR